MASNFDTATAAYSHSPSSSSSSDSDDDVDDVVVCIDDIDQRVVPTNFQHQGRGGKKRSHSFASEEDVARMAAGGIGERCVSSDMDWLCGELFEGRDYEDAVMMAAAAAAGEEDECDDEEEEDDEEEDRLQAAAAAVVASLAVDDDLKGKDTTNKVVSDSSLDGSEGAASVVGGIPPSSKPKARPSSSQVNLPPSTSSSSSSRFSRHDDHGDDDDGGLHRANKKQRKTTIANDAALPSGTTHPRASSPRRTTSSTALPPSSSRASSSSSQDHRGGLGIVATCVKCWHRGADVRVRCAGAGGLGCAYHARCLDLSTIVDAARGGGLRGGGMTTTTKKKNDADIDINIDYAIIGVPSPPEVDVTTCPCCSSPADGLEMLPLSFVWMDAAREETRAAYAGCRALTVPVAPSASDGVGGAAEAASTTVVPTAAPPHSGAMPRQRTVQCYDPSQPRTGRWTDEEILYRDALIARFLDGGLPLVDGLKLNDFLPAMLKSKQSRLAKKMKHARLSTKFYRPSSGCVLDVRSASEFSRLESDFVSSVPDPVERSEVSFHMGREWREHLANRCRALGVKIDGGAWLSSVEDMERRLAFEKERHRLARRRFMMGKAMERDAGEGILERGVFVDDAVDGGEEFELVVEKSVSNSIQASRGSTGTGSTMTTSPYPSPFLGGNHRPSTAGGGGPPSAGGVGGSSRRASQGEESFAGSFWTGTEPNLKHAAPFLSGIASYIERNGVPFEHVDVWVPRHVEDGGEFRLCFGGSMTLGVQVVNDPASGGVDVGPDPSPGVDPSGGGGGPSRRASLSAEDKFNLSLFGVYSQKFSFQSGCGLPGRIFKSGIPAWEQFVCNAPPELFERRGGAMQFGLKTALGIPIDSPNVGRVVLVLYSKHDRTKDEGLVARMMCDLKLLCPAPRWKLVVDVDAPVGCGQLRPSPPAIKLPWRSDHPVGSDDCDSAASSKGRRIKDLFALLASHVPPSEMYGPLGPHLQNIMSLRMLLLRENSRTHEEEQLVDTVLVLYESYLQAGRKQADIVVMVARDFAFHYSHIGGMAMKFAPPPGGHPQHASPAVPAAMGGFNTPHQRHLNPPSSPRMGSNLMMNYNHVMDHHQQQQQHQHSIVDQFMPFYRQVVSPKSDGSH